MPQWSPPAGRKREDSDVSLLPLTLLNTPMGMSGDFLRRTFSGTFSHGCPREGLDGVTGSFEAHAAGSAAGARAVAGSGGEVGAAGGGAAEWATGDVFAQAAGGWLRHVCRRDEVRRCRSPTPWSGR